MIIAVDFDGTIVEQGSRSYEDVTTPLVFKAGARRGLRALKKAGHTLLLWSARASPALLEDPRLDPLVKAGVHPANMKRWKKMQPVHRARHRQMLDFVERELPDAFDAIDDGAAGKPPGVDLFIDDKVLRLGYGTGGFAWDAIAGMYGEPVYDEEDAA